MNRAHYLLLTLLLVAACDNAAAPSDRLPEPSTAAKEIIATAPSRDLNVDERKVIDEIGQRYPGLPPELFQLLISSAVVGVSAPENPSLQRLLVRLDSARHVEGNIAIFGGIRDARSARTSQQVDLLISDLLPNPRAEAMVVQEAGAGATPMVILRSASANPATFAAALRALRTAQRRTAASGQAFRVSLGGATLPSAWSRSGLAAQAQADIDRAQREPQRYVKGLGKARGISIFLRR